MVECDLAKVEVAGSNPVSRSIFLAFRSSPPHISAHKEVAAVFASTETPIERLLPMSGQPLTRPHRLRGLGGCLLGIHGRGLANPDGNQVTIAPPTHIAASA